MVVFFSLSPILGMMCCRKKEHLTRQHPSLEPITAEFIDTFEILIQMPKFGQELSICICLSPVKIVDFIHQKWERCIVINLLIFVVVSQNISNCLCERSLKACIFYGQCRPTIKDIVFLSNIFSLKVSPTHPSLQWGQHHYFWKPQQRMSPHI